MKCPCKGCKERYVGCHAQCDRYRNWSNYDKAKKAKERKQKAYDREYTENYYLPSRAGKRKFGS